MGIGTIATIVGGLASVAPEVIGMISGDDAEEQAAQVADIAKSVTGESDPQTAVDTIKQDPEQARKFKESLLNYRIKKEQEHTKQLTQINKTMRAEYNEGGWKSGWRPFFGYIFAVAFGMMIFGFMALFFYFATQSLEQAIRLISKAPQFVTAFTPMFSVGLMVLGINIKKRSDDKELAAGIDPTQKIGLLTKFRNLFSKSKEGK